MARWTKQIQYGGVYRKGGRWFFQVRTARTGKLVETVEIVLKDGRPSFLRRFS
jgi:hypothetical protein